jgi:hypothetical protein
VPKSKDEWDKLAQENPKRWIELTQPRMDQAIREGREAREKAAALEAKQKNYEAELENFRKNAAPAPEVQDEQPKSFSMNNLPKTDEEWDLLFIEDPKKATDLRVFKANQDMEYQQRHNKEQLDFAILEFSKDDKKILVSHTRTWDESTKPEVGAEPRPKASGKSKPAPAPAKVQKADVTTLGDISALSDLKKEMEATEKEDAKPKSKAKSKKTNAPADESAE